MATLSSIITPTNVLTSSNTATLINKTLVDPNISLGGSNGTVGQLPVSQGTGLPPVWTTVSTFTTGDVVLTNRTLSTPDWLPADGGVYLQSSYAALYAEVGLLASNTAAVAWTTRTTGIGGISVQTTGFAYGAGTYVLTANSVAAYTSTDAVTWTPRTITNFVPLAIIYANGLFVAVGGGANGRIFTSPNGITWTSRLAYAADSLNAITYANGIFVAVGQTGTIFTSTDGLTWTSRTLGTTGSFRTIAYGNGIFMAGTGTTIFTSPDGITWTARTSTNHNSIIYANGLFITGNIEPTLGVSYVIYTTTDGIVWKTTYPNLPYITSPTKFLFVNGLFVNTVDGNTSGAVYVSTDLVYWVKRLDTSGGIKVNGYGNNLFFVSHTNSTTNVTVTVTSTLGYDSATQFAVPSAYLGINAAAGVVPYVKT